MIILEDKNRVPSKEEIESLIENFQAIQVGLENSKRIYHKDIFGIELLVSNIKKSLLPKKRIHEKGFPVNTFRFALEEFAGAVINLNAHEIYKYRPDIEFIVGWLSKNPAKNDIIVGS
jgi:hypothetical protein